MSSPVRYLLLVCLFLPLVDSEKKTLCPDSKKAIFNWLPYGDELKYSNRTGMRGDLHGFLKNALKVCCSTLDLTYAKMRVNSSKEIELAIRTDHSPWVALYFPVFANKYQKEKFQRPFIGLYDSPGPIVFEIDQHKQKGAVLNALTRSWQIPALCVLLASISGVILWFLDHKHNKRELPQEFHKGSFVGLWWAFVTMTTVGYGDIAPKSFRGRLFAVIWMIIGCIALTLFNAQLTAMITSNEIPSEINLIGKKIFIPRGGKPFLEQELNLGATQFQEEDFSELVKKIRAKTDELLMMYNYENIKMAESFGKAATDKSTIKVLKTIDHRFTIGITASGNISNTENFLRCVERLVVDSIVVKKQKVFADLLSYMPTKKLTTKNTELPYSLETIATLVALSILILLVVVGLVLEYCGKRASTSGYSHADENHDQIQLNQTPSQPLQDQKPDNGWYKSRDWPSKVV